MPILILKAKASTAALLILEKLVCYKINKPAASKETN